MNEEIKYLKNTIKTFIDLKKKKFDLRIMFLVFFFPLRRVFFFFFFVYQLSQTTKQLSYFISKYVYTISCWLALKGRKIRIPGWMKVETDCVLCLKKNNKHLLTNWYQNCISESADAGLPFFPITLDTFPIKANTCCISHFPP